MKIWAKKKIEGTEKSNQSYLPSDGVHLMINSQNIIEDTND